MGASKILPKNERTNLFCLPWKVKSKQIKFDRSFFGRIYSAAICFRFHLTFSKQTKSEDNTLESGINIPLRLLMYEKNLLGLRPYYGLKRLKFYYISLHILRSYVYSFCESFQRLCLFKGLHLFQARTYMLWEIVEIIKI